MFIALAIASTLFATEPPRTSPNLSRGVNLSHWFWYPGNPDPAAMQRYITSQDVTQLASAGITHVRVPIEPSRLFDVSSGTLNEANIASYVQGLTLFTSKGIAVIVDPHPNKTPWADPNSTEFDTQYPLFWSALATRLASTDPRYYVLEVMNEPHDLKDASRWSTVQEKIITVIRAATPTHTIIATGDEWGSIKGLTRLTLSPQLAADRNIIYSFHFYDPHTFTHQGATWGAPNWKHLRDVPYPASSDRLKQALDATVHQDGKNELRWYGEQAWDASKVTLEIEKASGWARAQTPPVRLYCGEFGVHGKGTRPVERAAWLRDVRSTLEARGIGWAMWDYSGSFALATGKPGDRTLDVNITQALGLPTVMPEDQSDPAAPDLPHPKLAPPLRPIDPAP